MRQRRIQEIKAKSMLCLATIMLFKAFLAPAIFIDFKLNQEYISKVLCINRDKPELECDGHCVLMDKMKNTQDADHPEQSQGAKSHLIEIFAEIESIFQPLLIFTDKRSFFAFNESAVSDHFYNIFCPPKIS